jgi:DNA modification methylase
MAILDEIIEAIGVEPYHREPAGVIYNRDCLDILPKIPEKSIDLVITSPPFNVGKDYGESTSDNLSDEDYQNMLGEVLGGAIRATSTALYVFIGTNQMIRLGNMVKVYQWLFWHRPNIVSPSLKMAWIPTVTPIAMICPNGRPKMQQASIPCRTFSLITATSPQSSFGGDLKRVHVCQDPTDAVKPLIARTPSDLILDPFLGAGTTAVAAKQLGRKFIGIEIEEKYCDIAVDRLRQEELF